MDIDEAFYVENDIYRSWADHRLTFTVASKASGNKGYRRPQRAAAFAVLSHLDSDPNSPATVVMPTGTGKTDTILSIIIAGLFPRTLIVVPSEALRTQTTGKLVTLDTLRKIGAITDQAISPLVHAVDGLASASDLDAVAQANVTVTTAAALVPLNDDELKRFLAHFTHLVFDEAHHVVADSWDRVSRAFAGKPRLYFTATPFRLDEQRIGGKIVFNYPLRQAQDDGYFQKIEFHPIREYREDAVDRAIATKALTLLRADLVEGYDHLLIARASSIAKAKVLLTLYEELNDEGDFGLCPVLVHSRERGNQEKLHALYTRHSRVVVCVSMLGEGFDLPELKVAAIHDHHKSPAVTLQFIGRLTRVDPKLGTAKFVANVANHTVEGQMRQLYEDGADWGSVIREVSEQKIGRELEIQQLEEKFEGNQDWEKIASLNPNPNLSAIAYSVDVKNWNPANAQHLTGRGEELRLCAVSGDGRLVVAVTRASAMVPWAATEIIASTTWHLYMAYYSEETSTLFVTTTSDEGQREKLLKLVSRDAERVDGERVFRIMSGINFLKLQNVGLIRGTRNVRFTMHVGGDVNAFMDDLENGKAIKSNIFGTGYAHGDTATAGCSSKGKLWTMDSGTIDQWTRWCDLVATKLVDDTIDTAKILANVMRVEQLRDAWPDGLFFADWPDTIGIDTEGKWEVSIDGQPFPITSLRLDRPEPDAPRVMAIPLIGTEADGQERELVRIRIYLTDDGYRCEAGTATLYGASKQHSLADYLNRNPLRLLRVDGSFILGNYRYFSEKSLNVLLPLDRMTAWDWGSTNINNESMKHPNDFDTVQGYTYLKIRDQYDVIFNDDGAGEVADLVAIRERDGVIFVDLYHCKYCSAGATPGARVDDTYVVSGQASRSVKWLNRGGAIFQRLLERYGKSVGGLNDRLLKGAPQDLDVFKSKSRNLEVRLNFIIVQPAVSAARVSQEMLTVFGSSYVYLKSIANTELRVICSR